MFRYDTLISTRTYQTIVRSFAAELETIGLWQWAVFVLLHLPGYVPVYDTEEANDAVMAASDDIDQYVQYGGMRSRFIPADGLQLTLGWDVMYSRASDLKRRHMLCLCQIPGIRG